MSSEIFLIDANSLITPYNLYYSFDLAPSFWTQLESNIRNGKIAILDMIKNEMIKSNNDLKEWIESIDIKFYIDHREERILEVYSAVLQHIQDNPCYQDRALREWSREGVADPWLIAAAATYGCTIITLEIPNYGLNPRYPSRNPKIPDVAYEFGVKAENLFYLMHELKFKL